VLRQMPIFDGPAVTGYVDLMSERAYRYRKGQASELMQIPAAMLADEAAKLPAKKWATIAPNYEYGQSAVAAFKKLLSAKRPDIQWVGEQWPPQGKIDAGAVAALRRGKSLLPAGVIRVDGSFSRGDAVVIRGPDGVEIGRGLTAYDAEDAGRIIGKSSGDILLILGNPGRTVMIHRDDLALWRE